jgi:branched-chain amino acid transport system ATP-binding protein
MPADFGCRQRLAGSAPLATGRVVFNDEVIGSANPRMSAGIRQIVYKGLCLVPEGRRLFSGLSVQDNLKFGSYLVPGGELQEDRRHTYVIFPKLHERRDQDVVSLSGGEKQMVAIGRALMSRPKLLMIDEMSLGLAPVIIEHLMDVLIELNRKTGLTLILVDEFLSHLGKAVTKMLFFAHGELQRSLPAGTLAADASALYLGRQND